MCEHVEAKGVCFDNCNQIVIIFIAVSINKFNTNKICTYIFSFLLYTMYICMHVTFLLIYFTIIKTTRKKNRTDFCKISVKFILIFCLIKYNIWPYLVQLLAFIQ